MNHWASTTRLRWFGLICVVVAALLGVLGESSSYTVAIERTAQVGQQPLLQLHGDATADTTNNYAFNSNSLSEPLYDHAAEPAQRFGIGRLGLLGLAAATLATVTSRWRKV